MFVQKPSPIKTPMWSEALAALSVGTWDLTIARVKGLSTFFFFFLAECQGFST